MRRREFITVIGAAALGCPLATGAQQARRARPIGVAMLYPEKDPQGQLHSAAFQQQLEKLGWTVGANLDKGEPNSSRHFHRQR